LNNKRSIMLFSSFRAQFFLIIGLLVFIFLLILINLYAGRFVERIARNHSRMIELEARFLQLVSQESISLRRENSFRGMIAEYSKHNASCLQCHEKKFAFLTARGDLLKGLRNGSEASADLHADVLKRLQDMTASVRHIHDNHITSLKNQSLSGEEEKEVISADTAFPKRISRPDSELEIISHIVVIQHSIADLMSNFYSLTREADLREIQLNFNENLAIFSESVSRFKEHSFDAQDLLLVEQLQENGLVFQNSLNTLIGLMVQQREFLTKLKENRETVVESVSRGESKLLRNLVRHSKRIVFLKWFTIVIVILIFIASLIKSRGIVRSITDIVRETEKIEKDFTYRIKDDPSIIDEFQVLTQSLNSMATKIEKKVKNLRLEIEQRISVEEKLSAEKERLAVTLKSIGDGVITTDINGSIVLMNEVAEQLTGWEMEEAVGQPLGGVLDIRNERNGRPCDSLVEEVIRQNRIVDIGNQLMLRAKDGSSCSVADRGAPIRDDEGQIIGIVIVLRDVSERLRMEDELLKMKKLESLGVLAGGIAHDFNNILLAILGNINLAGRYIDKENVASELLLEAGKAANRAQGLTQQLLTFSKGGQPIKKTASIAKLIQDSANFVLRGSSIACKYHFADDLWLADIDEGQMSQVIQNVTLNASHAMTEGGEIVIRCENIADISQETVMVTDHKEFVKVVIADQGRGIAQSYLDKIFDPYFSTKEEGSGLGLAVSHSIVTKHGGLIRVESEVDKGTIVTIYLPAVRGRIEEEVEQVDINHNCIGRVMVMDDDEMVLRITDNILGHMGYDVVLASNGEEAIERYRESFEGEDPIDVIIMDLTIPGGMGGKEAVIKILEINDKAKVVVASGYSNDQIIANFKDYGFQGALVKPFDLHDIGRVLDEILES